MTPGSAWLVVVGGMVVGSRDHLFVKAPMSGGACRVHSLATPSTPRCAGSLPSWVYTIQSLDIASLVGMR